MAELFTDGTGSSNEPVPETPETPQETTPVSTPVPTVAPVQETPVSDAAVNPDGRTDLSDLSADTANPEELETVPADGMTEQIDYTELLIKQTEQLEALTLEDQRLNQNMSSLLNAMPVICVALGMIIGTLFLQILSYFFKH